MLLHYTCRCPLTAQVRKEQAKFGAILDNLRREKEDKEMTHEKLLAQREKRLSETNKQLTYAQSKLQSHAQVRPRGPRSSGESN